MLLADLEFRDYLSLRYVPVIRLFRHLLGLLGPLQHLRDLVVLRVLCLPEPQLVQAALKLRPDR